MWKTEGEGTKWVPVLNETEVRLGIPADLLARIAYQESRFRADVIDGTVVSSAGAVGLMQLEPKWFPEAGKDPGADVLEAGKLLVSLRNRFQDWTVAVAAYDWGEGNIHESWIQHQNAYVVEDFPSETQNYVRQILQDIPVRGALS